MQRIRTMHLFAGAGGGILADLLLGHQPVCAVEINQYCQQVLSARQKDGCLPWFPIFADVTQFDGKPWRGIVDVVSGGFPCQAFSKAARGHNTARDYWPEMLRIVGEVCPRFVWAENVSEDAICVAQADLSQAGYTTMRVRIDAGQLGADHIRERWWLAAHADGYSKLGSPLNEKMEMLREKRSAFWKTHPCESRMDDGVAYRMDRLKAIGNGQVPLVAKTAWELLNAIP